MRLWQVYPACPRCKADAGTPCQSRQRGREGRPRKNPCEERYRLLGGDRWARGDEIQCSGRKGRDGGGCRNLATWVFKMYLSGEQYRRPSQSCNLHKASHLRLLKERAGYGLRIEVEPFQDGTARPPGKTNKPMRTR